MVGFLYVLTLPKYIQTDLRVSHSYSMCVQTPVVTVFNR